MEVDWLTKTKERERKNEKSQHTKMIRTTSSERRAQHTIVCTVKKEMVLFHWKKKQKQNLQKTTRRSSSTRLCVCECAHVDNVTHTHTQADQCVNT